MAFRPGLWPTLMVAAALPVLLGLGTWQVQRLHWKTDLIRTLEARLGEPPVALPATAALDSGWSDRRVVVEASLAPEPVLAFGVQQRGGRVGHHVLQRARLVDGRDLIVDRGWRADDDPVPLATPVGPAPLAGALRWIEGVSKPWLAPANEPGGRWYWYDLAGLEAAFGTELVPVVLRVTDGVGGAGVPVPQPVAVDLPNNHLGYAITWYGLAAALLGIYVAFGRARGRGRGGTP